MSPPSLPMPAIDRQPRPGARLWRAIRRWLSLIVNAPFLLGLTLVLYAVAGTPPWRWRPAPRERTPTGDGRAMARLDQVPVSSAER